MGVGMSSNTASRSVRVGYGLVTAMLVLGIAYGVLALTSIVVGLARNGESLLYGDELPVAAQISPEDIGPLPPGVRIVSWPDVTVEIADPTPKQMLLRSALDLGPLALLIAGLWIGRAFLRSVLAGDPFGTPNVGRLRAIGFLLVIGVSVVTLLNYSLRLALFNVLPPFPSIDLGMEGLSIPGNALLAGLGAFILAEVFAYGSRLREDVEATI
jgi:hypothetical protein